MRKGRGRLVAVPGVGLAAALAIYAMSVAPPEGNGASTMMTTEDEWSYRVLFTVGESSGDYTPVGRFDGIAAFDRGDTLELLVNHELTVGTGSTYRLANGAELDGARISTFTLDKATLEITAAGIAFDTIYGRPEDNDGSSQHNIVDGAEDLSFGGLSRLCSAQGYAAGESGFVDDIFFVGEEAGEGTEWALDVATGEMWAAPDLGRGSWENVSAIDTGRSNTTGLVLGDDNAPAPMYLYLGEKVQGGNFLERNGLVDGQLYVYIADAGTTPEEFNGTGSRTGGRFVQIDAAHTDGTYKSAGELRSEARAIGAFMFSRPEDVATSPTDGRLVAFNSTGRGAIHPSDDWGTIYLVDIDAVETGRPTTVGADLTILHDADDYGDFGIRSPDNLDWADDGYLYVQEDPATQVGAFGSESGRDASIWRLSPKDGAYSRIAEVDGSAVPSGQARPSPELGTWETSGILDVTHLLGASSTVLVGDVQAASIERFRPGTPEVVQGGQLFLLLEN